MNLTCFNCKKPWEVSQAHILGAKLKFGLGFKEHGFICPNCKTRNTVTKVDFEYALEHPNQVAVPSPSIPKDSGDDVKPVTVGPGPALLQRHGVVIVRSLHVRKDHSTKAETMAGLIRGEKVTVLGTWTDGKNTWAQLGPDRWAAIIYNGEPLIELSD